MRRLAKLAKTAGSLFALTGALGVATSVFADETYQYDALGRLITVVSSTGHLTGYSYDASGNRQTVTQGTIDGLFQTWAASSLPHVIGYADVDGWAVTAGTGSNYLSYGPYAVIGAGDHVAAFKLMVDNNSADNAQIVTIDINDATANVSLGSRTILRSQWKAPYQYQYFYIPFSIPASGHALEYRVFYGCCSYVRLGSVAVR